MIDDISNKTIVVLVILTVVISILGTVVVLNEIGNTQVAVSQPAEAGGQVTMQLPSEPMASTGRVTLEILPPE